MGCCDPLCSTRILALIAHLIAVSPGRISMPHTCCIQVLHIPGFTFPVEEKYLEDILQLTQ